MSRIQHSANPVGGFLTTLWLLSGLTLWAAPCVVTNEAQVFAFEGGVLGTNRFITLSWESCPDHLYEVQTLENPSQPIWQRMVLMFGGDGVTSWTDTNAPAYTQRYYRVQRLRFHGDEDEDGYTNLQEYRAGTAPNDAGSYPATIPPGLAAWRKFDGFGGSLDSSLNGRDASLYGASSLAPGVLSNAVLIKMQNNTYFETPCDTNLMPSDTFTLSSWINTTAHAWDWPMSRHTFAGAVATGWNLNRTFKTFQLWTARGDVYFWQNSCPNVTNIASGRLVTPYQWHLLAVVCSQTNVCLYVDGRLVTQSTIDCPLPVSQWLQIGGRVASQVVSTNEFRLDDVRMYRRALDPAEIQLLYGEDMDGDRIPNWWMSTYFGHGTGQGSDGTLATDDYDGDGYGNLQEYQLRTRPNAAYSYPSDPPRNIVAWWKLDEGMGTTVFDSSLNGRHGYLTGGNPAGSWTTGYLSNAVTLGGPSSTWVQVPYQSGITPTQELTLTGWVKPFGQGVLAANWDSGAQRNGNYRLQFGPDHIELWFSPAGDGVYDALHFNPNWSTNEWHHIAVCYGGDNLGVFVDGELQESRVVPGPLSAVPNPITIGFPGLAEASSVDDVRLYNRALGTNEIASMSRGNGLPVTMIVGQTARLRAFGAAESVPCEWTVVSGRGFFTNTVGCTSEFRPSWSGAVTVQVVYASSGVLRTNRSRTSVAFPSLSRISDWNDPNPIVQYNNNCYNFATDIRTDSYAQPGGKFHLWDCVNQTSDAISDGLRAGVDLDDLCHTSGLPEGHIVALLTVPPGADYHWMRMEADGTWSGKYGTLVATPFDGSGQPITDPRTAWFAPIWGTNPWEFCGFFWVGPEVHIH